MGNIVLQQNVIFKPYSGQDLSLNNTVHIFCISVDTCFNKLVPAGILSTEELNKADKFYHQSDRESYIVSKYFLRIILSHFLVIAPVAINYQYTDRKKPFLPGIEFNMSHAKNKVVIAVSKKKIGIDTEFVIPNFDFSAIADNCFNEEELSFINQSTNPTLNFYTLWTRKEAILKATGEGLVENLNQVPSIAAEVNRAGNTFKLDSYKIGETYILSTAIQQDEPLAVYLWNYIL